MITESEIRVLELIIQAHAEFMQLDTQHPSEKQEWVQSVHRLQGMIGMRIARRAAPEIFPITKNGQKERTMTDVVTIDSEKDFYADDELYCDWYKCHSCGDTYVRNRDNYCSN